MPLDVSELKVVNNSTVYKAVLAFCIMHRFL